jgi:hypothetical protein
MYDIVRQHSELAGHMFCACSCYALTEFLLAALALPNYATKQSFAHADHTGKFFPA